MLKKACGPHHWSHAPIKNGSSATLSGSIAVAIDVTALSFAPIKNDSSAILRAGTGNPAWVILIPF
jgi:hypothetical protein